MDHSQPKPVDADFSGAEIKACCRLAALLDVSLVEAAQNVVPVARTAHERSNGLRQWASDRCLIGRRSGHFSCQWQPGPQRKARPEVGRDPSNN